VSQPPKEGRMKANPRAGSRGNLDTAQQVFDQVDSEFRSIFSSTGNSYVSVYSKGVEKDGIVVEVTALTRHVFNLSQQEALTYIPPDHKSEIDELERHILNPVKRLLRRIWRETRFGGVVICIVRKQDKRITVRIKVSESHLIHVRGGHYIRIAPRVH
jgi:hypothetical protein